MSIRESLEQLMKENREVIGILSINPNDVTLRATVQLRNNNSAISIIMDTLEKLSTATDTVGMPKVPEGFSDLEKKYGL